MTPPAKSPTAFSNIHQQHIFAQVLIEIYLVKDELSEKVAFDYSARFSQV